MNVPFKALRAFEATARLGSFGRAADELAVTPAAVGQQVRGLEALIGTPLFRRTPAGMVPTAAAAASLPVLRAGFARLGKGFQALMPDVDDRRIEISVAPTFALKWLVPRLPAFYERHPGLEIAVDTAMRLLDIAGGEADVALRFGDGRYRGVRHEVLFGESVLPVCAPGLVAPAGSIRSAADLARLPLVHVDGETVDPSWPSWPDWAALFGAGAAQFDAGPRFSQSASALQAALAGHGVALSGLCFALDDILAGRLVAPLGPGSVVPTSFRYGLVYPAAKAERRALRVFRQWIVAEAHAMQKAIDAFLAG